LRSQKIGPDAEGERQRRHDAETEHPAAAFAGVEGEADQVGDEDPDRHRQLEEADQPARLSGGATSEM
jgi:hypothetical protein